MEHETPRSATLTPFQRETAGNGDAEVTTSTSSAADKTASTQADVLRISALSLLVLLILVGNVVVIITIVGRAQMRHKHVNIFILNLAVGDLMVCFLTTVQTVTATAFGGHWVLGSVACKLIPYVHVVTVASTTFLLTAMSTDRYQVQIVIRENGN